MPKFRVKTRKGRHYVSLGNWDESVTWAIEFDAPQNKGKANDFATQLEARVALRWENVTFAIRRAEFAQKKLDEQLVAN